MLGTLVGLGFVCLGAGLLALAAYPSDLRPEGIEAETETQFETGATLSPAEATRRIRGADGDDEAYLQTVTATVHRAMAHHWPPSVEGSPYDTRVPPTENYLLWALSYAPGRYGRYFRTYNFLTDERAFERGFGQCAQFVYALCDVLEREGFDARYQSLDGHVVAVVTRDGEEFVLDPDYDVVVPHALAEIRQNPALVREYYAGATPIREHVEKARYPLEYVESLYEPPYADFDPSAYHLSTIERVSYALLWVIPAALLAVGGAVLWLSRTIVLSPS